MTPTQETHMTTRLKGPQNTGGFGHGGESYEADADGFIEIPDELVQHAYTHGFVITAKTEAGEGADVKLESLTNKQLAAFAKENFGIDLDPSLKKKDLLAAIEAAKTEAGEGAAT
jgi:hypothetical protein